MARTDGPLHLFGRHSFPKRGAPPSTSKAERGDGRDFMTLPALSLLDGTEVDLWPRVIAGAGGPPLSDEIENASKRRVAIRSARALDTTETQALLDELERSDPDDYWFSGSTRAKAVGVSDRGAVGMLALAAAWESS